MTDSFRRFIRNPGAVLSFAVILLYALAALLAQLHWIAWPWNSALAGSYRPPSTESFALLLGTDLFGQSVLYKVIHGTRVAMGVALASTLISVPVGVILGALAGYFGRWLDDLVMWVITTVSSVPQIMLLIAVTFVLGKGTPAVALALGLTTWITLARIVRGEFMKHKEREYVMAAASIGAGHGARIFRHILPNVVPVVLVQFSLQFMAAIKAEVILSYLGLGVQGQPSWGVMIDDARMELARGVWWQLAGATTAMFFVVLAFNIFGDALRDALDPKLK